MTSLTPLNISLLALAGLFILYVVLEQNNNSENYENNENPRVQTINKNNQMTQDSQMTQNNQIHQQGENQTQSLANELGPLNPIPYNESVLPYPQQSNLYEQQSEFVPPTNPNSCNQPDVLNAQDLLPKPDPNASWNWDLSNPQVNGSLNDRNFLSNAQAYGINTTSGSLKNGNQSLRTDPYIQPATKEQVPFGLSTYAPDLNRRTFEIGGN